MVLLKLTRGGVTDNSGELPIRKLWKVRQPVMSEGVVEGYDALQHRDARNSAAGVKQGSYKEL